MLRRIAPAVLVCLLLAQAAFAQRATRLPPPRLPKNALRVPLVSQSTSWSCGAGSLLSVLYYWKAYDGPERTLHRMLGTTAANGTHPARIAKTAREFGLKARLQERMTLGDLRRALGRGETVILDFQAWREPPPGTTPPAWKDTWDDGHYSVLIGMDDHHAYFMDPSAHMGYGTMPLHELRDRWHDFETTTGRNKRYYQTGIIISGQQSPGNRAVLVPMQ